MSNLTLEIHKLKKALLSLEAIYLQPNREDRSNIDATIQRFEFTFELLWKALKSFLQQKGLEIHYPKEVLKEAYAGNLLEDESIWLAMLKDRNLTSHTYDEELADQIFDRIKQYVPIIRKTFDTLSKIDISNKRGS